MSSSPPTSNPFPGLRPFRTDEHHLFFGREEQTAELLKLLGTHRFLAVVGTSGSGKSSLVRAGLIPALHRGTMTKAGSFWEVVVLRPGGSPIRNLARALIDADLYDADDPESLPQLSATLTRSRHGLVEAVKQSDVFEPGTNLFVVVDQFEELFRFRQGGTDTEEAATAFVSLLLTAAEAADCPIYIATTMRSDYLGDCSEIPGLAEAVNRGEYLIPRLLRDQKREAIEMPVGVGGARIAPRLVQRMLNQVGDDPDQLPVLQHALMRTWDVWAADHTGDKSIDLRHFEATGGMEEALSRHADEVYDSLPSDEHRSICRRAFQTLTEKGSDNRGIRRPKRLRNLEAIIGCDRASLLTVLDAFRQPGVTFLMPGLELSPDDLTVIDVSHESLMRVWRRLRNWVEDEAQSARIYRRLQDTAELWTKGEAGYFRDPDLQIATTWRESTQPTQAWAEQYGGSFAIALQFLEDSRAESDAEEREREAARERELAQAKALAEAEHRRAADRDRSARRLKVFAGGIALVTIIAVVAFFQASRSRREADRNAQVAEEKGQEAEAATRELSDFLVRNDFSAGGKLIEEGRSDDGLAYVSRALRSDPTHWPSAMRSLSSLASGRFQLRNFPIIEHELPISRWEANSNEDLILTSDEGMGASLAETKRYVWDLRTAERLYEVKVEGKALKQVAWSKDDTTLQGLLEDGSQILCWKARSGKLALTITVQPPAVDFQSLEHPEKGSLIVARLVDRTIRIIDATSGEALASDLRKGNIPTVGFGASNDGRLLSHFSADGSIAVRETATGRAFLECFWREAFPYMWFSPDGRYLFSRSRTGRDIAWWSVPPPPTDAVADSDTLPRRAPEPTVLRFEDPCVPWFLPGGDKVAIFASRQVPRASQEPSLTRLTIAVHDLASGERAALFTPQPLTPGGPPGDIYGWYADSKDPGELTFGVLAVRENATPASISLWDLESGTVLPPLVTPWQIDEFHYFPDGRRIATVSHGRELMVWDIFTRTMAWPKPVQLGGGTEGSIRLAASPDGEILLTTQWPKTITEFWDSRTGKAIVEPTHGWDFASAVVSESGDRVMLWNRETTTRGSSGGSTLTRSKIRVVDVARRTIVHERLLQGADGDLPSASWSRDGRRLVVAGARKPSEPHEIIIFDAKTRAELHSVKMRAGIKIRSLALAPDDRHALVGTSGSRLLWIDLETGVVERNFAVPGVPQDFSISANERLVAINCSSGDISFFDIVAGAPVGDPIKQGSGSSNEVRVSPDGRQVASACGGTHFHFFDIDRGKPSFPTVETTQFSVAILYLPGGREALGVRFGKTQVVIDIESGKELRTIPTEFSAIAAELSPNGRIFAMGGGSNSVFAEGAVSLHDVKTGARVGPLLDHESQVHTIVWSPDGKLLATGALLRGSGSLHVWEVDSGRQLIDPVIDAKLCAAIEFSPDGQSIVAAWEGGAARRIDLPPRASSSPVWLPEVIESVARRRLEADAVNPTVVSHTELAGARDAALSTESGPDEQRGFHRWASWFFQDPVDRTLSPDSRETLSSYLSKLRTSDQRDDLIEALRYKPSDPWAHARLGKSLLDDLPGPGTVPDGLIRHWRDTAERYIDRAIELDADNPEIWALRAEWYAAAGRIEEARQALARAASLESQPGPNVAYLEALELARDERWKEADAKLDRTFELLSRSAAEGDKDSRTPLLGILVAFSPRAPSSDYFELKIPDPIPGTLHDFDSVAEGDLPDGWRTEPHGFGQRPRLSPSVVGAAPHVDAYPGAFVARATRFGRADSLRPGRATRINGKVPTELIHGRFVRIGGRSENAEAPLSSFETTDFDLRGKSGVHVGFASAIQLQGSFFGIVEYSIDRGESWLPGGYFINGEHLVYSKTGKLEAVTTLERVRPGIPLLVDEEGELLGGRYDTWIRAPISEDLGRFFFPRRSLSPSSRQLELLRLEQADGQPHVRLRVARVGGPATSVWDIDELALYELPAGVERSRPARFDPTAEPAILAFSGLQAFSGFVPPTGGEGLLDARILGSVPLAPSQIAEAKWIGRPVDRRSSTGRFRRTFELSSAARSAHLLVTGDRSIRVLLNGEPVLTSSEPKTLDSQLVTHLVRKGKNTLAVELDSPGEFGGLLFRLSVLLENGRLETLVSDDATRVTQESFSDTSWTTADFDDSGWTSARVLGDYGIKPWGHFVERGNRVSVTTELRLAGALLVRRAARLEPDDALVRATAAFVCAQLGLLDEASEHVQRVLALVERSPFTNRVLATIWAARGDQFAAEGDLDRAGIAYELTARLANPDGRFAPAILDRLRSVGLVEGTRTLIPRGAEWKFQDIGPFPPDDWKTLEFDDSAWRSGPARLGYGEVRDGEPLERTLLNAGSSSNRRPSVHFRHSFNVEDLTKISLLKLRLLRDDGAVVYLNGEEIRRDNMPEGPILPTTFASGTVDLDDEMKFFEFEATTQALREGQNVLAVEVHQRAPSSSDLSFDLELTARAKLDVSALPEPSRLEQLEEELGLDVAIRALLWSRRGRDLTESEDFDAARSALDRAIALAPNSSASLYQEAFYLYRSGEETRAQETFIRAANAALALKRSERQEELSQLPEIVANHVEPLLETRALDLARSGLDHHGHASGAYQNDTLWLLEWAAGLGGDHEDRTAVAELALAVGDSERALTLADAGLADDARAGTARGERERREWLRVRERALTQLDRTEDAESARQKLLETPTRDPSLSAKQLDLTEHYNAGLYDARSVTENDTNLRFLAETLRPRDGVEFDVRGFVQLNSGDYPEDEKDSRLRGKDLSQALSTTFPEAVEGIEVGQTASEIRFLLGAKFQRAEKDETVARVVVHFTDGSAEEMPLRADVDVIDWEKIPDKFDRKRLAWIGRVNSQGDKRYLTHATWKNPAPEKTIRSIDIVSTKATCAPFLVAVTVR